MYNLKYFFFIVDFGFIIYWVITAFNLIPAEYLYNDYTNPILINWNWSFLPLDVLISITGLTSIRLYHKKNIQWKMCALTSLILTFTSGLQAISYWVIAKDFNFTWWLINGFLLIYPLFFIPKFFKIS